MKRGPVQVEIGLESPLSAYGCAQNYPTPIMEMSCGMIALTTLMLHTPVTITTTWKEMKAGLAGMDLGVEHHQCA
jgi:hypothetical protein